MLLRKRDIELTVADLEEPADDPREWAALRHNLAHVERDREAAIAALSAAHEGALANLRADYERSASWRITRPLRAVTRAARRLRGVIAARRNRSA